MTHWKKIVSDPNYIGEADFEENEEKVLTIARVNASETEALDGNVADGVGNPDAVEHGSGAAGVVDAADGIPDLLHHLVRVICGQFVKDDLKMVIGLPDTLIVIAELEPLIALGEGQQHCRHAFGQVLIHAGVPFSPCAR